MSVIPYAIVQDYFLSTFHCHMGQFMDRGQTRANIRAISCQTRDTHDRSMRFRPHTPDMQIGDLHIAQGFNMLAYLGFQNRVRGVQQHGCELAPGDWTDCLTRVLISPTGERTDKQ